MMFVTNGVVQDLPQDQKFAFWSGQLDFGRAFKIAKIEQAGVLGISKAPNFEMLVHLMLQEVSKEKWGVFTSRPVGQTINWCRWASFCKWFFGYSIENQMLLMDDIRRGAINVWFTAFNANASTLIKSRNCCKTDAAVDGARFWDFHEFDTQYCKSTRKLPEKWPTPQELAEMTKAANWYASLWGPLATKNFFDSPPSPADNAASFSPKVPEPVEDEMVNNSPTKSSPIWGWVLLSVGVTALASMVIFSPSKGIVVR